MNFICLDIGGTHLRAARLNEQANILDQRRIPTLAHERNVTQRLFEVIAALWPTDAPVQAIAAAIPGPVTPDGRILSAPNVPEWKNTPLQARLAARFGVPVWLANDANLAALGEWRYGAGRGSQNMLYLTISTGIGGGVICNGQLLTGTHNLAAELGHVPINEAGPRCSCGQPGHLEAYASGTAIAAWVQEEIARGRPTRLVPPLAAAEIAAAARQGDALAQEAYQRAGFYLGLALSGFIHIFNPQIVVLGGGVAQSSDLLFPPLRQALQARIFRPDYLQTLQLRPSQLGDDAGLLGALALALNHQ